MEKKYELVESNIEGLYRIKAVRDFGDVKAGDIGGCVSGEHNLSHEGLCWVYDDAVVYEDARILGNARVSENAGIYGTARISENSYVYQNARVFGSACVYGQAEVLENSYVYENARVFGHARVFGNAEVFGHARVFGKCKKTPLCITLASVNVTIADDTMVCGCQRKTIDKWLAITDFSLYPKNYVQMKDFIREGIRLHTGK